MAWGGFNAYSKGVYIWRMTAETTFVPSSGKLIVYYIESNPDTLPFRNTLSYLLQQNVL